jgi:4-alpha-glucanotransferase
MSHLRASPRLSGILLHPTSLPSPFGVGDFGPGARRFVDLMATAGQRLWQVLPINTIYEPWFSPYSALSAFAGNPLLISPESLWEQGLLGMETLEAARRPALGRVDFGQAFVLKEALFVQASQAFARQASPAQREQFEQFQHEEREWLEDYALFMVIRKEQGRSWRRWEEGLRFHTPSALEEVRRQKADEVFHQKFLQFEFHRQWRELRRYANARGVRILGDVPIYVSLRSADVWAHRELFQFKPETLALSVVSGAPPDNDFSSEGQRWGSPLYDWSHMARDDYRWWAARLRHNMRSFDYVRLDHFPAFESAWAIPDESPSPRHGHWQKGPGSAFFDAMQRQLGPLPVVVEDLGFVTPAMHALREEFRFPGMFVLQYALTSGRQALTRPGLCREDSLIYTGTHDTNTSVGWFHSLHEPERRLVAEFLGQCEPGAVHQEMIRLAWASEARWAVAPLQDVIGLGSEGRMNIPGIGASDNWNWCFLWEQLTEESLRWLASLTRLHGRASAPAGEPSPLPEPSR